LVNRLNRRFYKMVDVKRSLLVILCGFFNLPVLIGQTNDLLVPFQDVPVSINGEKLAFPWNSGINSAQLNQADLDGDGVDELIILDRSSRQIDIFSYKSGEYVPQPDFIHLLPPINRDWVIFADYDCDGRKDIFNYRTAGVTVYRNISTSGTAQWELVTEQLKTLGFSGLINIVINSPDVPAIVDIDGDGDLDILAYNFALGEDIRLNQNMSVEKTGGCGELDFEITNRTWGAFKECFCHTYAFGGQTCAEVSAGRVAHTSGKSLVAYDIDNDQLKDVFLSHSDCDDLIFLPNVGTQSSALFTSFQIQYPENSTPISMPIYPTVKFTDIDFDQKTDMVASTNIDFNFEFDSDFAHSVWLYENAGTREQADFQIKTKSFLQDQMIDLGEQSQPVFFDYDKDGDQDLLVAANGKKQNDKFYGYVAVFENIGNRFYPEFQLSDDDFLNLSSLNLFVPKLRFKDFNHDGRTDLFFSGYNYDDNKVQCFIFYDESGSKGPPKFSLSEGREIALPLGIFDNPEFLDINGDLEMDLLVGDNDGSLNLYENRGGLVFELTEGDYLGIGRDFTLTKLNVYPLVTDYDFDGNEDLIVADAKDLSVYYNFRNSSDPKPILLKSYNKFLDAGDSISMEFNNSVAVSDLYGTKFNSVILGGSGGGLRFFRSQYELDHPDEAEHTVNIYPNPVKDGQLLKVESYDSGVLKMYNIWGQLTGEFRFSEKSVSKIDVETLASGVYILVFTSDSGGSSTHKIIIQK